MTRTPDGKSIVAVVVEDGHRRCRLSATILSFYPSLSLVLYGHVTPPSPSPLPDDDNHDNDKRRRVRFPPPSIYHRRTPMAAAICRNLNRYLSFIDGAFCFPPAVKLVVELFVPDAPPPPDAPKQCYTPPNSHPQRRRHNADISHGRAAAEGPSPPKAAARSEGTT